MVKGVAEILRGVYPELAEGLRMTLGNSGWERTNVGAGFMPARMCGWTVELSGGARLPRKARAGRQPSFRNPLQADIRNLDSRLRGNDSLAKSFWELDSQALTSR